MNRFLFACLLVPLAPLPAQDLASDWFPMTVGNQWTYEHVDREILGGTTYTRRWQTVETITGIVAIPEGTVVLRRVAFEGKTPGGWLHTTWGGSHYLIRNECLYFLDSYDSWNEAEPSLRAGYRERLLAGDVEPEFCFPLEVGKSYGKEALGWVPTRVMGVGTSHTLDLTPGDGWGRQEPPAMPGSEKAFDVLVHLVTADETHLWFEKGLGITGVWDLHHGTYLEYQVHLLRFQPAR